MGSNNHPDPLMPQVGLSLVHPEKGEFKVLKSLASGPFSDVFKVLHVCTNQKYAMKVEKDHGTIRPVLKLDVYVLTQMTKNPRSVGFPKLICAGRTGYYKYAIMQLVGTDLGKLRRAMPEKRFTSGTALRVALQMLNRIETLHELGWLCRDVKANNFAIGRDRQADTVFMLDFGFARRYVDLKGKLLPSRNAAALLGTIHYAPIASHYNQEQCRRDDLESWLYTIVEITGGPLPWVDLEPMKHHKMIAESKKFARVGGRAKFFEKCPAGFDEIMDIIDNTSFFEKPDYGKIAGILETCMNLLDVDRNAPLDWMGDNGVLLQKAQFVGDMGESHMMTLRLRHHLDLLDNLKTPPMDEEESPSELEHKHLELARLPDEPLSKDEQIGAIKTAICSTPPLNRNHGVF